MVTVAEVRALARTLPRSSEHLIPDRVKFRVGAIVYIAFSRDETTMGFGYPKEERAALVASDPELFFLHGESDLRFNWVCCHLARLVNSEDQVSYTSQIARFSLASARSSSPPIRPSSTC